MAYTYQTRISINVRVPVHVYAHRLKKSMFITCIMSGSGDRRLEGGVECLSGDWDPWEAVGTGKR